MKKCEEEIEINYTVFILYQSSVVVGYVQSDSYWWNSYVSFSVCLFFSFFLNSRINFPSPVIVWTSNARIILNRDWVFE